MPGPQSITCESWNDFKAEKLTSLYKRDALDRALFYFRGQGSPDWPLISSFDRWFRDRGGIRSQKQRASERLLELFQEEAQRTEDQRFDWHDPKQRLALAQHYGVPTRLLDWTESPYIAAFFAFAGIVESPDLDKSVVIWCLDRRNAIWTAEHGVELLSLNSPYNERLRSQLGKFTYLRAAYDTLEEHVAHFPGEESALIRYILPRKEARIALADLDAMGINYSTVYTGLAGAAGAANLRMLLEAKHRGFIESSA